MSKYTLLRLLRWSMLGVLTLCFGLQGTAAFAQGEADLRLVRHWEAPVKVDGGEQIYRVEIHFDYAKGQAKKIVYDAGGGVVEDIWLEGAPSVTPNELADAFEIVKADPEFGTLVADNNAIVDGGFLLMEEEGKACAYPGSRCVQVDILTNSGLRRLRYVIVDLMTQEITYRNYVPVTPSR